MDQDRQAATDKLEAAQKELAESNKAAEEANEARKQAEQEAKEALANKVATLKLKAREEKEAREAA